MSYREVFDWIAGLMIINNKYYELKNAKKCISKMGNKYYEKNENDLLIN